MRHGRPNVPRNPALMDRHEFNRYLDAYDAAGLSDQEDTRLRLLYAKWPEPDVIISSDLPRALATAHLFARHHEVVTSPLLREIPVRLPDDSTKFLRGRWPTEVWWTYLRYHWFKNQEPEGRIRSAERALSAIQFIAQHRQPRARLAVVSHAGFLLLMVNLMQRRSQVGGRRLPHIGYGEPTPYYWR